MVGSVDRDGIALHKVDIKRTALIQEIRAIMDPAPPVSQSGATPPDTRQLIVDSSARLDDLATRIYRALRVARSALAPTTLA